MSQNGRRAIFVEGVPVQEAGQTPAIEAVANLVRALYCTQFRLASGDPTYGNDYLPQWDGGEDAYGRHHRCVWPRLAQFFMERHIDPGAYLRLQFSHRRGQTPPTPTMLTSPRALEQYRDFASSEVARQRDNWAYQCEMFVIAMATTKLAYPNETPERLVKLTLISPNFRTASALFKYCLAMKSGMSQVASIYYQDALVQYVFQRQQLNEAIGVDLPEELRNSADLLYARLSQQEVL